jgi:hypothetical protein
MQEKAVKTRGMMLVIIAGCLIAGVAGAQMPQGMSMAPKSGQAKKGMIAGGMMKKCQAMMVGREDMMTKMKAMDETVDQLVATMNAADRDHKVEAMSAVIGELVAQRKAMREMNGQMNSRMMGHMMEHMHSGTMTAMASCPMMKAMAEEAPKPGSDDHATHH